MRYVQSMGGDAGIVVGMGGGVGGCLEEVTEGLVGCEG